MIGFRLQVTGYGTRQKAKSFGANAQSLSPTPKTYNLFSGQRGFSLVETLVAITILLIAVLAPMRIASQSIKTAGFAREQLTAVFLAQEGIETVIRLRDDDSLDGSGGTWDWFSSLPSACKDTDDGCSYNPSSDSFVSCATLTNCKLYLDTTGGSNNVYYTHTAGSLPASPYTRVVTVTEEQTGEVNIQSVVSWYSAMFATTTNITLRTRIFDQYEQ